MERLSDQGYAFHVHDFHRAAEAGKVEVVEWFVEAGMAVDSVNETEKTALYQAVTGGHSEAAIRLIELGASHRWVDADGRSPLFHAVVAGDAELVEALLGAGADPCLADRSRWTPLSEAAFKGHAAVVALLAPRDENGLDKALHLACVGGDVTTVGILLKEGASVFARSSEEKTALMYAATHGHLSSVKLLIRNGANRFAMDAQELTAFQLADRAGFSEVAALLAEPLPDLRSDPEFPSLVRASGFKDRENSLQSVELPEGFVDFAEKLSAAERAASGGVGNADLHVSGQRMPRNTDSVRARAMRPLHTGQVSLGGLGAKASFYSLGAGGAPAREVSTIGTSKRMPVPSLEMPRRGKAGRPQRVDGLALDRPLMTAGERAGDASGASRKPSLRMHRYRESQLPVMLLDVESKEEQRAIIRLLYGDSEELLKAGPGEMIASTGLRVVGIERRFAQIKHGKGESVNVSQMIVEDTASGHRHLVVRGLPAMSNNVYALVTLGDDDKVYYDARIGDRFTADAGSESYRVLAVRPKQIVIQEERSREVFAVLRTHRQASVDF